ncbi:D-alanine--poly(phosphoribitol) ligase [Streptomyces sp. WZ.A104]|nr:D-alanine--poly(phosphoribitol) ligase [Streptomyces sp. WZ.A104]
MLDAAADRAPSALAVVDGEVRLDYGTLERRANQVARLLSARGVRRGERVGLCLEKSADALVGLYGILKAGAAYVPLDPRAPAARSALICDDADVRTVLTSTSMSAWWPTLRDGAPGVGTFLCLDAEPAAADPPHGVEVIGKEALALAGASRPEYHVGGDDLAYVLYTSGSTGTPKGVMLTHRNALAFVEWAVETYELTAEDRLSGHAPLQFDLSVLDLFGAAMAGAALVLVPYPATVFPAQAAALIRQHRVTVWYSVPSALVLLALRGGLVVRDLPSLRTVLFAGEVFPLPHLRRLTELLPHVRFANLFGPTETNVCLAYDVPSPLPESDRPLPIGRPIRGVRVFVVTDDGRIARPGEQGELWVSGPTVTLGYLGDEARTRASFGYAPEDGTGAPAYRTGDLVVRDADGLHHFVGRADAQLKSRGYRIEPGEIEAVLGRHPAVVECAVVPVSQPPIGHRIVAHVSAPGASAQDLLAHCRAHLPAYMVPSGVSLHDALPRTSRGKLDRRALSPER